jgi:hypothetical protein
MFRANLFEILKSFWYKDEKISEKKIAILIGNTYEKTINYVLRSSDNDIIQIKKLLIDIFNYTENNIYILKNSTKKNILDLFKKINSNDQIFFYFTGHGIKNGLITEDLQILYNYEIRKYLINKLPKTVKLVGLIDSCHSENKFNLPYYYYKNKWLKYDNNKPVCNVIMLSACMKNQITHQRFYNNKYQSFITNIFINIIYQNINITWHALLDEINKLLILNDYNQTAILSSSDIFNLDTPI